MRRPYCSTISPLGGNSGKILFLTDFYQNGACMKKQAYLIAPLFLLLLAASLSAADPQADRGIYDMFHHQVISLQEMSYNCSAAAALVMRDGKILYEEYFGTTHKGPGAGKITADSRFPYYSVSKEFGCAVLLSLVTEGKLGLDDPVVKYLDYFKGPGPGGAFPREKVTLRQLASHTSGVVLKGEKEPEGEQPFAGVTLEFEPGSGWHYNELGMKILAAVMQKVTGKPYEMLLRERILEPLELKSVGWVNPGDNLAGVVYTFYGPDSSRIDYSGKPYPGSGLFGNMRDLLRFAQLWLDGGKIGDKVVFRKELIQEAWIDQVRGKGPSPDTEYGLMFWLLSDYHAAFLAGAAQTVTAVLPDQNIIVLMGLNQCDGSPGWGRPPVAHSRIALMGIALADLLDRQSKGGH